MSCDVQRAISISRLVKRRKILLVAGSQNDSNNYATSDDILIGKRLFDN